MARPTRRRKVKNPNQKVSRRGANRRYRKNPVPIHTGVPGILMPHWSATDGLQANYQRWGLAPRLNKLTGGTQVEWSNIVDGTNDPELLMDDWNPELDGGLDLNARKAHLILKNKHVEISDEAILQSLDSRENDENLIEEAVVERDENGNIIAIKSFERRRVEKQSKEPTKVPEVASEVVKALEEHAANAAKTERVLAPGEIDFVKKCIEKYGDNYSKMARDLKLNYLQLTPRQIEKKCSAYMLSQSQ